MTPFRDRNFDSSEFQSGPFNGRRTRLFRRCEILFAKFHNHRALGSSEKKACSGTRELDRRMKPSALVSRYRVIIRWKRTWSGSVQNVAKSTRPAVRAFRYLCLAPFFPRGQSPGRDYRTKRLYRFIFVSSHGNRKRITASEPRRQRSQRRRIQHVLGR